MVNTTPCVLYPGERGPVPILQEARWASGLVCMSTEILPLPGFELWTAQSVASCYTDHATLAAQDKASEQLIYYFLTYTDRPILLAVTDRLGMHKGCRIRNI
jgi:hypothetical protein